MAELRKLGSVLSSAVVLCGSCGAPLSNLRQRDTFDVGILSVEPGEETIVKIESINRFEETTYHCPACDAEIETYIEKE